MATLQVQDAAVGLLVLSYVYKVDVESFNEADCHSVINDFCTVYSASQTSSSPSRDSRFVRT